MEVKFNSLFDNDFHESEPEYYPVDKVDDALLLTNLLLTFDKKSAEENVNIFERNFGESNNYRLGPRPCSTLPASSDKFCDHPGLPEVYIEEVDKCKHYFMPNSNIGERNQYLRNIDIEARLTKRDFNDSKCDEKKYKDDMCDKNNKDCVLNCEQNLLNKDNVGNNKVYGENVVNRNRQQYCDSRSNNQAEIMKNFMTFQPTKRRDVLNW